MDKTKAYIYKINLVTDYIEKHLGCRITLSKLSSIAALSQFHFHRIFRSFTGEALYDFILRLRVEKAAAILSSKTGSTITQAAFECGFNDSATFARAFKKYFKVAAGTWVKKYFKKSKIRQARTGHNSYTCSSLKSRVKPLGVDIRVIDEMNIIYVRRTGAFAGNPRFFTEMHGELMRKISSSGYNGVSGGSIVIIYHDAFGITSKNRLRVTYGITAPVNGMTDNTINKLTIASGLYAVCRFEPGADDYAAAWGYVYAKALPRLGYFPDDRPCFELYSQSEKKCNKSKYPVDICVPVRRT